jgi:small subunit ribosomal protein S1
MNKISSEPVSLEDDGLQETSNFGEILSHFESQTRQRGETDVVTGTVVSAGPEWVLMDIGRKIEGALPLAKWYETEQEDPRPGATVTVSVGPRNVEGYFELSTIRVEQPKDWAGLQRAFAEKRNITGMVLEQVKGGYRVDIGVPAFMPVSRSGVRETEHMAALVGQRIECRITKLDVEKEDVVVDRRVVLEEEQARRRERALEELREGAVVRGRVRTVMDYGAFLDIGGIDGLLHVADIAHTRVAKVSDVLQPGDEMEVKVLKVDTATGRVSLGLKQLQEEPWSIAARTFQVGDRVSGTVTRLADFGAFVELMPGVDGLIHLSELSWNKRVRKPGDLLKIGERVEAVILQIDPAERRIALGYKQVLGDPWESVPERFPVGAVVEGAVTNIAQFGAFVELADGVEGLVHISDITSEKRLQHAREKLAKGQRVKAIVLEVDREKRRLRLGMKQLEPTPVDRYIAEHRPGDLITGRVVEIEADRAKVELDEGIIGTCQIGEGEQQAAERQSRPTDVSSLGAMLAAKWREGGLGGTAREKARRGQMRKFRILRLDASRKLIELELAS